MANLEIYRRYVKEMKEYATENGISASETNKIFEKCFRTLEKKFTKKALAIKKPPFRVLKHLILIVFGIIVCAFVSYNHPATHTFVLRNLQHFIYPGMKAWRKIAVPIVERFPSLSEWYDESCLLENPYFRVDEMDCRPCSFIGENSPTFSVDNGIPFTRKETDEGAKYEDLAELYHKNQDMFNDEANTVSSNNPSHRTIRNVFEKKTDAFPSPSRDNHVVWRISRIKPGRLIRKLFPRPSGVPNSWSQSTERFVFIDEPKAAAYPLPNPECSNVALKCSSGSRLMNMIPTAECLQSCRPFTIVLAARHTLWYNWWYWRPLSLPPINSTDVTLSYLTSFC